MGVDTYILNPSSYNATSISHYNSATQSILNSQSHSEEGHTFFVVEEDVVVPILGEEG